MIMSLLTAGALKFLFAYIEFTARHSREACPREGGEQESPQNNPKTSSAISIITAYDTALIPLL